MVSGTPTVDLRSFAQHISGDSLKSFLCILANRYFTILLNILFWDLRSGRAYSENHFKRL